MYMRPESTASVAGTLETTYKQVNQENTEYYLVEIGLRRITRLFRNRTFEELKWLVNNCWPLTMASQCQPLDMVPGV